MLEDVICDEPECFEENAFLEDVVEGLSSAKKYLPCKYFYDERGSELFQKICETSEYYVTKIEIELLKKIVPDIANRLGKGVDLLEFGSGAGEKIRLLLDALERPASYTPMDISEEVLLQSSKDLRRQYPEIQVRPWVGDYTQGLSKKLNNLDRNSRQVVFFPGSTISNFTPKEAKDFLTEVSFWLGKGGVLLVGVDTVKSESILNAAYNDAEGHTAAFNLNLLDRIRDQLSVDIEPDSFSHQAFFNQDKSRIEMHLVANREQVVRIAEKSILFKEGESIHTENSYKYKVDDFHCLARSAGFRVEKTWLADEDMFSFHYLVSEAASFS